MATSFGSAFAKVMAMATFTDGAFDEPVLGPVEPLQLSPAAHVLHYGSACFEGLKAHKGADGTVRIFRLEAHVARMQRSCRALFLPVPDADVLAGMITDVVRANLDEVPDPPGALYLRPAMIGTEPNIGAAARASNQGLLYVLASPVGDYFDSSKTLVLGVETDLPRTTPQFGEVKTGANYAMALGVTRRYAAEHGTDQVLFAPNGEVQETGAANFMMIEDRTIITRALDSSFLHGITRDSVLTLAKEHGFDVEERTITVEELTSRIGTAEAALSGTAAVLAPVGALVVDGERLTVRDGQPGPMTTELRAALTAIQRAEVEDTFGWTTPVTA